MDIIQSIIDRVIKNPKTTIAAIAPLIVAIIAKQGFNIPSALVETILSAVYGLILLFIKDHKPAPAVTDVDASKVVAAKVDIQAALDKAVNDILGRV